MRFTIKANPAELRALQRTANGIVGKRMREAGDQMIERMKELAELRLNLGRPQSRRRHVGPHYDECFVQRAPTLDKGRARLTIVNTHPMARGLENGIPPHLIPPGESGWLVFPENSFANASPRDYAFPGPPMFATQRVVNWAPQPENANGFQIMRDGGDEVRQDLRRRPPKVTFRMTIAENPRP